MSVYETGFLGKNCLNHFAVQSLTVFELCLFSKVSGPPKSLSQLSKNENTMTIVWEHPVTSNGVILEYHVAASPVSSYSVSTVGLPMEWVFSNTTTTAELPGLQPGTQYNVTVRAKTMDGYGVPISDILNTEIGGKITVTI
jgi:hypothetical protein